MYTYIYNIYIYIYIHMCIYIYIYIYMSCRAIGWHYLSNATCLIRPRLFYACFVVKDHHDLLCYSPPLKNTCVRQAASECIENTIDMNIPFILFKMNHYLPKLVVTATCHLIMPSGYLTVCCYCLVLRVSYSLAWYLLSVCDVFR